MVLFVYGRAVLILATKLLISSCLDIERLQTFPIPMKSLDLEKYSGYWFIQGRYVPCSWAGSKTFTDIVFYVQLQGKSYTIRTYWRQDDICTDVFSKADLKSPGIFLQTDSIGNLYSGEWYIIETDYKKYSIFYGCTKPSVTRGTCADYYVTVETRQRHPDSYTMAKIERVLKKRFGLSFEDLVISSQKKPCVKTPSKPHAVYSHLSKKY